MTNTIDYPDTVPDQNIVAERAVLGAMLWSGPAVNIARLELTAASFYRPQNAELFATICDLEDQGHRVDFQLLITHLAAQKKLGTDGTITNYIHDLWHDCITAANIEYHAREVRSAARVRALQAEHQRLGQALAQAAQNGDTEALLDMAAQQSIALQLITDAPASDAPVEGLSMWDEFVTSKSGEDRWIVAGLIQRHDVIMILAAPGAGKSFLSRQVCTSLAAGLHPFDLKRIPPVRTLLVDLENAPGQVAEESLPLLGQVKRLGDWVGDRGWVWMRPEGLNLRRHDDAMLFERVIAETRPDVVAFGSLYNAYQRGSSDWDTAASEVQEVLKRIRKRYNVAFWLEHHMPRAVGGHTGTPFGGTSWERWPTHGRVLRRAHDKLAVYLLEAGTFRGDRGARELPIALLRGGKLPYTAIYEEAELEQLLEAASG